MGPWESRRISSYLRNLGIYKHCQRHLATRWWHLLGFNWFPNLQLTPGRRVNFWVHCASGNVFILATKLWKVVFSGCLVPPSWSRTLLRLDWLQLSLKASDQAHCTGLDQSLFWITLCNSSSIRSSWSSRDWLTKGRFTEPPPPCPRFGKLCCAFFEWTLRIGVTTPSATKFFGSEMTHPLSEVYRKFIQNGTVSRPSNQLTHQGRF